MSARPLRVPRPQYFFMQTSLLPPCLRASTSQHISRPLHTHCLYTLSRPLKALSWSLKVPHGLYQPSNGLQITLTVFVSIYTASTNTIGLYLHAHSRPPQALSWPPQALSQPPQALLQPQIKINVIVSISILFATRPLQHFKCSLQCSSGIYEESQNFQKYTHSLWKAEPGQSLYNNLTASHGRIIAFIFLLSISV